LTALVTNNRTDAFDPNAYSAAGIRLCAWKLLERVRC
jgi:hypothetical protein